MNLGGRKVDIVVKAGLDPNVILAQVEACFARELPRFHDMPGIGKATGPVAIVAGGPSLNDELENIRNFPGPVIACGSVHDYLIDCGVIPQFAVMLDPDRVMADFVKRPHPDVCYLVASHCHSAMFDALAGMNIRVWHILYSHLIPEMNLRGEPDIGGGDGVVLRAWPIAAVMGHRDIHFFGFDLSFPIDCESQHAYDYDLLREEAVGVALNTGERFITSPGWMNQLKEFSQMVGMLHGQFELTIHGNGLVAATFCKGTSGGADERFANGVKALLRGDFAAGWAGYEYRQGLRGRGVPLPALKEWCGEPLVGKTLLLHGEQGHGDMLMVMRYVPILVQCGAKILMAIHAGLRPIAERIPGVTVIEDSPATWPPYDVWLGMMSLPHRFGTTLENILPPFEIPMRQGEVAKWRRVDLLGSLKIGLCWNSNPVGEIAEYKSIPLDALKPLVEIDADVAFVSLQVPDDSPEWMSVPRLDTFLDTTLVIANIDLVITVDTAVAHLGGTLGIPTWVILSNKSMHVPWMLDRTDSPWYPSVRLFRQREDEPDWSGVIGRVRDELAKMVLHQEAAE